MKRVDTSGRLQHGLAQNHGMAMHGAAWCGHCFDLLCTYLCTTSTATNANSHASGHQLGEQAFSTACGQDFQLWGMSVFTRATLCVVYNSVSQNT